MAACTRCYAILPAGATVCPSCGTPVGAAAGRPLPSPSTPMAPPPPTYGAPGAWAAAPPGLTVPLYPGETILATWSQDMAGMAAVNRGNAVTVVGIMLLIFVPFTALILLSGPPAQGVIFAVIPLLVILIVLLPIMRTPRHRPSALVLTDRRAIVERFSTRSQFTTQMGLETLGSVQVMQNSWATRRARMAWVYLLPMGTTEAMIGAGRGRMPSPGVIWIPAVPIADANALQNRVMTQARDYQRRLGLGAPTMPPPPPPPPR